jgi:hypothetical protein
MKASVLFALLLLCAGMNAQKLNYEYVKGIGWSTSKSQAIEVVVQNARAYFTNDVGGIQTTLRKEKNLKVKGKNLEGFLTEMEGDLRAMLQASDHWDEVDTYTKYRVYLGDIIGYTLLIPGWSQANTGIMGKGTVTYRFDDGFPVSMSASLQTTRDYTIFSGYPYSNEQLAIATDYLRSTYGNFTHKQYTSSWNSCTSNNEPVYTVIYDFKSEYYDATLTTEYGIYQKSTGAYKGACYAAGNHLTSISLTVTATDEGW